MYLSTGGVVLAHVWFTLNRKVNSKNQLNLFRITNAVAMTQAVLTSLNAIYDVFRIPLDSVYTTHLQMNVM